MKPESVPIDNFEFVGSIAGYTFQEVTGNQWDNALRRIGWREAHNAHLLMRLKQSDRGGAFGLRTLADFALAMKTGYTVPAQRGAFARVCRNGMFLVIFRGTEFITLTGARGE